MAKKIRMTGTEFTRLIQVMREFKTNTANSSSTKAEDLFYIETGRGKNGEAIATGYITDGYRGAVVRAPLTDVDAPFTGYLRNPPFIPKNTDFVTIEMRGKAAYVTYEMYGATFATPQPKENKGYGRTAKKVLLNAMKNASKASATVNDTFLAKATRAARIASGIARGRVTLSIGENANSPVKVSAPGMDAIVMPMKAPPVEN